MWELKEGIDNHFAVLQALKAFHQSSEDVTRQEFQLFAEYFFRREGGIQAIEWIPLVLRNERDDYEKTAQREGFPNFRIREKDDQDRLVKAAQRAEYYPVFFIEPYKGNEVALGYDLASDPIIRKTLTICRDTGRMAVTPPVFLVQDKGTQPGILVFLPVYRRGAAADSLESRRENLVGFYSVAFRLTDLLNHVLQGDRYSGIDVYVFGQSIDSKRNSLFFRSFPEKGTHFTNERQEAEVTAGLHFAESYNVGGREWTFLLAPTQSFQATRGTWMPWIALTLGIFTTALMTFSLAKILTAAEAARRHFRAEKASREALEQEIARREVTEQTMKESERRYRTLFESAMDAILIFEAGGADDGRTVAANNAAAQMHGYTMEEVLTLNARDILSPEYIARIPDFRARLLRGENLSEEIWCRKKNGTVFPIESNAQLIELDGRACVLAIGRDISDRKASEEALKRRDSQQRALLDNIPDMAWLKDAERKFIAVNEPFAKACGFRLEDVPGKTDLDVWPQDLAEQYRADDAEVMRTGVTKRLVEPLADHEGKIRWLETIKSPIRDGAGIIIGTTGIARDVTDRKEADEELRVRDSAIMTSINGVNFARPDGTIFYANIAFATMWGFQGHDEAVGLHSSDLWADGEAFAKAFAQLQRQGYYSGELRARKRDGTTFDVLCSVSTVFGDDGNPLVLMASFMDITERKRSERSLMESEERFRKSFENNPSLLTIVHMESHKHLEVNDAWARAMGHTREEAIGRTVAELGIYDEETYRRIMEEAKAKGSVKNVEVTVKDKTGAELALLMSREVIEMGGEPCVLGMGIDITDRVRAAELRELLATVVEHGADAVIITGPDGNIQYVNPAFERASGYKQDEAVGNNPRMLKSGKQDDAFYRELWATITAGRVWRGNFVNKRKDGSLFEEQATISPIRDTSGRIVNYVAVKRDVTKEAQLRRQLAQSQKMEAIGTLAGGIAHDFNNIIFAMTGYTELAMEDLPKESEARQDLERVLQASRRAGDMVKQILAFSRQGETERQLLDLAPVIKEGLKFLRASIPSTIEIRQQMKGATAKVFVDPTQIHQVLMNLCTNAAHSMRDTMGALSVELVEVTLDNDSIAQSLQVKPGRYVRLTVSDTGHGMPPATMQRIFEPYFTTKEVGEGTGLGMAVIHGIVKDHGGGITVSSEPGKGTTFNVFFPVTETQTRLETTVSAPTSPSRGERILFVDDEEVIVEMGQAVLRRLGYNVVVQTNPVEALALFRSDPQAFDLIITDLTMPKMTGLELISEIKLLRPEMSFLLCTGFGQEITEKRAREMGIHAVLRKPISKKDVARMVRQVLDRKG
jgi:PAS domain S-box-containing protein